MASGVYEIRNLASGNRYIGSAVDFDNRKRQHFQSLARGDHHCIALQRAWSKYTPDAFVFRPMLYCDKENLLMYEQIMLDGSQPEYNSAPKAGSQLGYKHTAETRAKMSASRPKGFSPMTGKKHSEEARARISASRKGKGGGPMSQERRDKIGAAHKGRVITEDARRKISASLMGHKQSQEQIAKRAQKLKGRKMPSGFAEAASARMKGVSLRPEHCQNIGRSKAKLNDEQVRMIRARRSAGESRAALAREFCIDPASITNIVARRSYAWVS